MPEDPKQGDDSKDGKKKGLLKELKKGNSRSLVGIAVALAGIIVAWFLYNRSQAQQQAAGATYMPYTPNATAGTSGVPMADDVANQLFSQQGQLQTSMDLGFSGLTDSLAGLSTKFDDLNSSLSSHETPGGTVVPGPKPVIPPKPVVTPIKRYVMQSGHPASYGYLASLGFIKGTPGHYVTTGKGGYPVGHPVDYAYLSKGSRTPIVRAA